MTKQGMNYLLGQMEELGYLIPTEDPEDQRAKRVYLTTRGRARWRTIRETVAQFEAEWAQQLGPERFAQLRDLLTELHEMARPRQHPDRPTHEPQGSQAATARPPGTKAATAGRSG
jgi:DNA-binding MarR family transcriptional regulator